MSHHTADSEIRTRTLSWNVYLRAQGKRPTLLERLTCEGDALRYVSACGKRWSGRLFVAATSA